MQYLAKPLTLTIEQCPPPNVCYLRWLSNLGTWEGWAWTTGEVKAQVDNPTQISTADGRTDVAVQRPASGRLTLIADDLSPAQYDALVSILSSPQVYRQYSNGARQPVLVAADSNATRLASATKSELEITISLPNRNDLTH
jgi:hypothetical protein